MKGRELGRARRKRLFEARAAELGMGARGGGDRGPVRRQQKQTGQIQGRNGGWAQGQQKKVASSSPEGLCPLMTLTVIGVTLHREDGAWAAGDPPVLGVDMLTAHCL